MHLRRVVLGSSLVLAVGVAAAGDRDPSPPGRLAVTEPRTTVGGELSLELQPAANQGPPPAPEHRGAVSLPWLDGPCGDPRFPALAGSWAVGCSGRLLDRAQSLLSGDQVPLQDAAERAGLAPGVVVGPTASWLLPTSEARRLPVLVSQDRAAPPATDGVGVAFITADEVQFFSLEQGGVQHLDAHPAPWYAPAISGEWVAWVESAPGSGEDIWVRRPGTYKGEALVEEPGQQRHVAASGRWLGWIDDDAVLVQDLESGERRRYPADAHTSRGLSLWGPVACWEQWNGSDVDLACSDGMRVEEPGHQRGPSRYGPWLMYRDEGVLKLATAKVLVLDDDDPRGLPLGPREARPDALRGAWVPAGVRYTLALPGSWQVQRWEGGAWSSPEPWTGELQASDGIRLSPASPAP